MRFRSKHSVFSYWVVLITFMSLTCADRPPISSDDATLNSDSGFTDQILLPLKIGNEWVYNYKNSQTGRTGLLTWKITGSSVIGGRTVFHLNQSLPAVGRDQTLLLANRNDGLYAVSKQFIHPPVSTSNIL